MQPFTIRRVHVPAMTTSCAPPDAVPPAARRILLVSGEPGHRAALSRILEQEGYVVDAVAHSGHALLLCRSMTFGVLLAELSGPDMTGPALAEQVRRHCPRISAVYLGNPGTPEGVDHLLVRPFTRDDLLAGVRTAAVSAASAPSR